MTAGSEPADAPEQSGQDSDSDVPDGECGSCQQKFNAQDEDSGLWNNTTVFVQGQNVIKLLL